MSAGRSGREADDERPDAVSHAEVGATAWRAVVLAQQSATPDHADFYALAGSLFEALVAVESLARVLARQVAGYADTVAGSGEGFVVYDDSREVDPELRLYAAQERLDHLAATVATAGRRLDEFWNAIGHIGVEPARPDTTDGPGAGPAAGGVPR